MNRKKYPKKTMRLQARFTLEEWREVEKKAHLYFKGSFSALLRESALNYKKKAT